MLKATNRIEQDEPKLALHNTDSSTSEDLLRLAKANLAAIIENSTATIYSLDREFRYVNFNNLLKESIRQIYGVEIHVGDVVFEFLYKNEPDEAERWRAIYMSALKGESIQFVREFHVGLYHAFIQFYINPIKEGLKVLGLSCMAIDITKERMAGIAIAHRESRFRALIENSQDAIMVRDANRKLVYASPSMGRMLGFDDGEVASYSGHEVLVHEEDIPRLRKLYEDTTASPGVPFPVTLRMRQKTGTYIWVEGVMTNMLDDPDVAAFVCNFRNITQRMELDLQNQKITSELVRRNEALEQYAYIVSHNLRAPIANLLGLSNLIEMPGISKQDKEIAMNRITCSARHLDDVVKDLSSILQAQEEINKHRETIKFQDIVDGVRDSIGHFITDNDVSIQTDFSRCDGIVSIKTYIHSIFYNLILNSVKYRRDNTRPIIKIKSLRQNGRITLLFEDNGLGMDLGAYGDKVFGLYRRFHPEHTEGKGMGLFMVKTQIRALGGKISVRSDVGIGTIFTIEL